MPNLCTSIKASWLWNYIHIYIKILPLHRFVESNIYTLIPEFHDFLNAKAMSLEEEDVTAFFAGLSSCNSDSSTGFLLLVNNAEVWFSVWESSIWGICKKHLTAYYKDNNIVHSLLSCTDVKLGLSWHWKVHVSFLQYIYSPTRYTM